MKKIQFYFYSLLLSYLGLASLEANQLASAKVLSVSGSAIVYTADSTEKPIDVGAVLTQGDTLITAESGKVHLVFSNGSELELKENTSLSLKEISQEPFIAYKAYEMLEADPSKSEWLLKLNYGEISGHVKQLRADSEFSVETEFGTAVIYGTKFDMGYYYDSISNQFIVSIHNENGLIDLLSRFSNEADFGRGNSASVAYNSAGKQSKKFIPPGHVVRISQSALGSEYSDLRKKFTSKVAKRKLPEIPVFEAFVPIDQPTVSRNTPDTESAAAADQSTTNNDTNSDSSDGTTVSDGTTDTANSGS